MALWEATQLSLDQPIPHSSLSMGSHELQETQRANPKTNRIRTSLTSRALKAGLLFLSRREPDLKTLSRHTISFSDCPEDKIKTVLALRLQPISQLAECGRAFQQV